MNSPAALDRRAVKGPASVRLTLDIFPLLHWLCVLSVVLRVSSSTEPNGQEENTMKKYYRFMLNYDEDETEVYSTDLEMKKGDVAVLPGGDDSFCIGVVMGPVSEFFALTACQPVEEIVCAVNMVEFRARRDAEIKRMQIQQIMNRKMDEIKTMDTLKKYADKDSDFKRLFDLYQKTLEAEQPAEAKPAEDTDKDKENQ